MNTIGEHSTNKNNQIKSDLRNEDHENNIGWEIIKAIKTTLGPSGMEKILKKRTGEVIISNDGATILDNMKYYLKLPRNSLFIE